LGLTVNRRVVAVAIAVAVLVVPPTLLLAQTGPMPLVPVTTVIENGAPRAPVAGAEQEALSTLEASLSLSTERVAALKAEIEALKGNRDRQNAELIAAATRVRSAEEDVAAMQKRLDALIVAELEVRGRLGGTSSTISSVLAALQRISREPPPALLVNPSDALGSARGAMLISAIVPQLRQKADELLADLGTLGEIKAAALAEEGKLKANFEVLEEEQLRIAALIAARRQSESRATAALAAEEASVAALAAQAASLKELIDELTRRAAAVAMAAQATAAANAGGPAPVLDSETIRIALANTDRTAPAVPFAQARGYLQLPSSGVRVIEYGASDGFGGISQGVSMVTRAEAAVVAPADGWVLYTGEYLNYGQIVILDTGQNYTILLAGLARTSVEVGQFLLMGEPVGVMGSRTIGATVTTSAGVSQPTLYIEMRRDNEPVDPTGWWAQSETPTQSG
jgi:septal ring factor EnvC (AmiA/AmiB activator)